jgi:hypothetical protein
MIIFIRLFTPPLGDIQIMFPGKGNFQCVALPSLTSVLLYDHHCKGERLQVVEIPHKREKSKKGKTVVFKLIIGSLERG